MKADSPSRRPSSAPTQPTAVPASPLTGTPTAPGAAAHAALEWVPRRASMDGAPAALPPPRMPVPVRTQTPPAGAGTSTGSEAPALTNAPASPARKPVEPTHEAVAKAVEESVSTRSSTNERQVSGNERSTTLTPVVGRQSAELPRTSTEMAPVEEPVPQVRKSTETKREEVSQTQMPETPSTPVPRASSEARPVEKPVVQPETASVKEPIQPERESVRVAPKASAERADEITASPLEATLMHRASTETSSSERAPLLGDVAQRMEAASRRPAAEPPDVFSVAGRMVRAAELLSRRFASDEALRDREVPPELHAAQQRLRVLLDGMQLDPTQNADEQRELKRLYIKENAPIEAAWSVLFGSRFVPGQSMQTPFAEGSINAAFEFVRGGISSFMRSPARNGSATEWRPQPGEELTFASVHSVDADAAGGGIGGGGSYTFEKAIEPSMLRQATKSNLPMLVEIPPELLAPTPGRVRQTNWRDEEGTRVVRFHIAGVTDEASRFEDGLPGASQHLAKLDSDVRQKRDSIALWQQGWNAGHYLALVQPFLTSCLNSLQPELLTEEARRQGGSVFAVSAFGSALAGALANGSLNLAKATPYLGQVRVNDAMGQPQWLNMYVVAGRNADSEVPLARWRDALHVPGAAARTLGNTLVETVKLPKELVLDPLHAIPDLLMRHVLPNVFVGVAAPAAAEKALGPLVDAVNTGALKGAAAAVVSRARYGLPSGLNDYLWPIMRDKMNPLKAKSDARRKERQDIKAADRTRLEANRDRIDTQLRQQQVRLPGLLDAATAASLSEHDRTALHQIAVAERLGRQDAARLRDVLGRLAPEAELTRELNLMAQALEQRARIDSKLAPPWTSRMTGRGREGRAEASHA